MLGNRFLQSFVISLGALLVAACGGGNASFLGSGSSSGGSSSGSSGSSSGGGSPASIVLLASSPQLLSAASTSDKGVTITAVVKDASNNLLSGTVVSFATSSGAVQPGGATDTNGTVSTVLTTGGDPSNRVITVTATAGSTQSTINVSEIGTTLSLTGSGVVGSGGTATLTATLTDSSGQGISGQTATLSSSVLNNPIAPASVTTDASGQAVFTYTGTTGGSDTVVASALGVTTSKIISVSPTNLVFQSPAANATIPFGQVSPVSVLYTNNGVPVAGATINFSATRGTLNGSSLSSTTAVTNGSGIAQVTIQSNGSSGAGGSVITAQVSGSGPSATVGVQLVATTPATISVQASSSSVATSATTAIKVLVRDASNNLVAAQPIQFTLSDPTGGGLSSSTAITDSSGSASVTYTAGTTTSPTNGVTVTATVTGTAVTSFAKITVGGQALFIRMGTSNLIDEYDPTGGKNFTEYQLPYSIVVTDAAGNAAPQNTVVTLKINSQSYEKGYWFLDVPNSTWAWVYQPKVDNDPNINLDPKKFGCANEDVNGNGVLDAGEDYNTNGILDPGNVATVQSSLTLDSTGSAGFLITYPKSFGEWVEVNLQATAIVAGTESSTTVTFVLQDLASDLQTLTVNPPVTGAIDPVNNKFASPFGYGDCGDPF